MFLKIKKRIRQAESSTALIKFLYFQIYCKFECQLMAHIQLHYDRADYSLKKNLSSFNPNETVIELLGII